MKNYILLFFGFACVGTYAADVMEYTVLADIPYYYGVNGLLAGNPSGYVTIEVTPTLTHLTIQNELQRTVGRGALLFDDGIVLRMPVNLMDARSIATIYGLMGN